MAFVKINVKVHIVVTLIGGYDVQPVQTYYGEFYGDFSGFQYFGTACVTCIMEIRSFPSDVISFVNGLEVMLIISWLRTSLGGSVQPLPVFSLPALRKYKLWSMIHFSKCQFSDKIQCIHTFHISITATRRTLPTTRTRLCYWTGLFFSGLENLLGRQNL